MTDDPSRPNPDVLLARAQAEEAKASRGKLKIFFGASAGVGKTYAMLKAAQQLRSQGVDVVIGLVETHGRSETAAQLQGLEVLPRRSVERSDKKAAASIGEFDLDAALARHPAVLVVDELAHSNAAGSRHPKRWQDIDELLVAGIDVISAVNVQHIESLNDVVGGITGIRVWETVPDRVFDEADEVVLVDLPTDDLLRRLQQGQVYLPEQAERAVQNFFRKGNLMALRELALRRTAERVDDEVRSYRRNMVHGGERTVWQTSDALLVCLGPQDGADKLVRAASRRASRSNAPWHAVYVETPTLQRLPESRRRTILRTLKLAESLGASTATLTGQNAADAVVAYAQEHNLGTLVVGRPSRGGGPMAALLRRWRGPQFVERVAALAPEVELMVVTLDSTVRPAGAVAREDAPPGRAPPWNGLAWALASSALLTALATPLVPFLDLANIIMLFLLVVVGVAVKFGRRAAFASAVLNVIAFDYFFVQPRFSFAVSDVQYLVTFAVMMIVGLVVGQLTASLRYQARIARYREDRARCLYEMSRELGVVLTQEQVAEVSDKYVEMGFRAKASVLCPDASGRLVNASPRSGDAPQLDFGIAQWAYDHAEAAGAGTDTLPASPLLYVPLKAPMRTRGVIAVEPANPRLLMIPEQRQLLDTYAALVAIAIERVHFVTVAQETLVTMESERLRNSLLAALSHDLRTPLTSLVGLSESLTHALRRDGSPQSTAAQAIHTQALRTAQLVNNLLDMARLQAGAVTLRRDWQSLEELAGSAIRSIEGALAAHPVRVNLPTDLPLLHGDAVLLERVLVNLLENAAKYTPPGTTITLGARQEGERIAVEVSDEGPGLPVDVTPSPEAGTPAEASERLFDKFTRGAKESSTPGVGLGLAICRAIVQAHGGSIGAANRTAPQHGAVFRFTLPHVPSPPLAEGSAMIPD
ncbi:MAG: two-component system sensor histidine kinase KdpD [Burkholderiaceae bacterium]|nr:two-component system sensor histidine kinase KdpD [Burkholderiaceae bacterium]